MLTMSVLHMEAQDSGVKGDANNDGAVTITDAVAVVNYTLNTPPVTFIFAQADVNEDDAITITDAIGIVNIILKGNGHPRLVVLLKDGHKDYYELSDTPVTTFGGGNLVITFMNGSTVSYPLNTVQRYMYDGVKTGITEQAPEIGTDVHVFQDGNMLTLSHVPEGNDVSLYSSDGQLLETHTGSGKPILISVDSRPDGMYIVKTGTQTFKLMKQ